MAINTFYGWKELGKKPSRAFKKTEFAHIKRFSLAFAFLNLIPFFLLLFLALVAMVKFSVLSIEQAFALLAIAFGASYFIIPKFASAAMESIAVSRKAKRRKVK